MRIVHCAGAWTDELAAAGYDPVKPRAREVWAAGSQIFVSVYIGVHINVHGWICDIDEVYSPWLA